jgi:hypothetical protein
VQPRQIKNKTKQDDTKQNNNKKRAMVSNAVSACNIAVLYYQREECPNGIKDHKITQKKGQNKTRRKATLY